MTATLGPWRGSRVSAGGIMMGLIKGHTITLRQRIQVGTDPFNDPIYENQEIQIDNVLVSPVSTDDIVEELELYGKKAVYKIAIPKGDTHVWDGQTVILQDHEWSVYTFPQEYYPEDTPLDWYKEYYIERYD